MFCKMGWCRRFSGQNPRRGFGGRGGKGEEFKDQHVGKGRRIEEGDDRHGGTGVDSSSERAGPEDCRHGHDFCIGRRLGNMVDCRMIDTEDCGTSGVSLFGECRGWRT